MNGLIQNARFAVRHLSKSPGSVAVALLTLAMGIGANTALFSIVNGVLLNSLTFPQADRLIALGENKRRAGRRKSIPWWHCRASEI